MTKESSEISQNAGDPKDFGFDYQERLSKITFILKLVWDSIPPYEKLMIMVGKADVPEPIWTLIECPEINLADLQLIFDQSSFWRVCYFSPTREQLEAMWKRKRQAILMTLSYEEQKKFRQIHGL